MCANISIHSPFWHFFSYFYWLDINSHLSRVPMTEILAANPTTNISSLPSREDVVNNTAYPNLSAFTIDLLNRNLVYVSSHSIFLRSLSAKQPREFYLGEQVQPLNIVSLYQNFAFSYVTEFLIITEMVLPLANVNDHQNLADYGTLGFTPTANSMFHESFQPLSGLCMCMLGMYKKFN